MSQAKVDNYKASKKNRKQEVAKQKAQKRLKNLIIILIVIAIIVWIVFSGIHFFQANQPVHTYNLDTSPVTNFLSSFQ